MRLTRTLILLTVLFTLLMGGGAVADSPKPVIIERQHLVVGSDMNLARFSIYNPHKELLDKVAHDKLVAHQKAVAKEKARLAAIAREKARAKALAAKIYASRIKPVIRPVLPSSAVSGCGDNQYAHFIYMRESGCRTHNPNGSGCDGIGQACPAGKVIGVCGYDYACQNRWFNNYAINRYGSWAAAYNFWIGNHYW